MRGCAWLAVRGDTEGWQQRLWDGTRACEAGRLRIRWQQQWRQPTEAEAGTRHATCELSWRSTTTKQRLPSAQRSPGSTSARAPPVPRGVSRRANAMLSPGSAKRPSSCRLQHAPPITAQVPSSVVYHGPVLTAQSSGGSPARWCWHLARRWRRHSTPALFMLLVWRIKVGSGTEESARQLRAAPAHSDCPSDDRGHRDTDTGCGCALDGLPVTRGRSTQPG